jgi:pimeloyl-ACP methyl ester carboxylesterase
VEPVLLKPVYTRLLNGLRPLAQHLVPMIRNTIRRTDRWPDEEAAFRHFRGKSVFAGLGDEDLRHYIEHGTRPGPDGGRILRYDKHWEAHCYSRIFNLWGIVEQLSVPVLAVRGGNSNTLPLQQWRRWQDRASHEFVEMPERGHLLPLEDPGELAELILAWTRRL